MVGVRAVWVIVCPRAVIPNYHWLSGAEVGSHVYRGIFRTQTTSLMLVPESDRGPVH